MNLKLVTIIGLLSMALTPAAKAADLLFSSEVTYRFNDRVSHRLSLIPTQDPGIVLISRDRNTCSGEVNGHQICNLAAIGGDFQNLVVRLEKVSETDQRIEYKLIPLTPTQMAENIIYDRGIISALDIRLSAEDYLTSNMISMSRDKQRQIIIQPKRINLSITQDGFKEDYVLSPPSFPLNH